MIAREMKEDAAKNLEFEKAALLRRVVELRRRRAARRSRVSGLGTLD